MCQRVLTLRVGLDCAELGSPVAISLALWLECRASHSQSDMHMACSMRPTCRSQATSLGGVSTTRIRNHARRLHRERSLETLQRP
jgi:hypothetical protein